jgi:hypothetical protein
MPFKQSWPLSQSANKRNGTCSVCLAQRQLHLSNGTIHMHGPRHKPCPGSNQPPLQNSSGAIGTQVALAAVANDADPASQCLVSESIALSPDCVDQFSDSPASQSTN